MKIENLLKRLPAVLGFSIVLLVAGCDNLARSDVPVSRAVALKILDMPLPASAREIYYLDFAGGSQDLERYVRFDVDPAELAPAVGALVESNNRMLGRSLPYPKSPLSSSNFSSPRSEFLPMPWWDPSSISRGYYRGHGDSHALRILADEGRSRIYVYQND